MVGVRVGVDDFVHMGDAQLLEHVQDALCLSRRRAVDEHRLAAAAQKRRVAVQNLREDDFQQVSVLRKGKIRRYIRRVDTVDDRLVRTLARRRPQQHQHRQQKCRRTPAESFPPRHHFIPPASYFHTFPAKKSALPP